MIEGLKVTITGTELQKLCEERRKFHLSRAQVYSDQQASMDASGVEAMNFSGGDPKRVMAERREQHENAAAELEFIADHLNLSETYLLGRDDLYKLGIYKERY